MSITPVRLVHPSGLFSYLYEAPCYQMEGMTEYHDCILLRDVNNGTLFHRPCLKGTPLVVISQFGFHLSGLNDMNDLILDVMLELTGKNT